MGRERAEPGGLGKTSAGPQRWGHSVAPVPATCPLTGLTWPMALARLAHEPDVVCLAGGLPGPAWIQWGVPAQRVASVSDLPLPEGSVQGAGVRGWPQSLGGGAFLQADYAWPVGSNAAQLAPSGTARIWPSTRVLHWDAQGRLRVQAATAQEGRRLVEELRARPVQTLRAPQLLPGLQGWQEPQHAQALDRVQAYIAAGDIYQANLTLAQQLRVQRCPGDDAALLIQLLQQSPAGYAALFRSGNHSVVGHSPECFLAGDAACLRSAPIKGTRAYGGDQAAVVRAELLSAQKDNAELAMIIDLVRNDLGRIAVPGGVHVEERPSVIDLSYVHHLVGTVAARPRAQSTLRDWLAAAFPAGSITGAPKIRAMHILADLEGAARGAYCGAYGWYARDACSLAVAIRTAELQDDHLILHAGGGIVADSQSPAEWQEVQHKLAAWRQVLEAACAV